MNKEPWDNLSITEKGKVIGLYIKNGIKELKDIVDSYNLVTKDNSTDYKDNNQRPAIPNGSIDYRPRPNEEKRVNYINLIPRPDNNKNSFKNGGDIYIKPSHRGRLTALKERTGKTEAELWKTGTSEVRKMITFARNARGWKHPDGGKLNKGDNWYVSTLDYLMRNSGGERSFWSILGNYLSTIPESQPYTGTINLGKDLTESKDIQKDRNLLNLYLYGDTTNIEPYLGEDKIKIKNKDTGKLEELNYPQYKGNMSPYSSINLSPESVKTLDSLVNNEVLIPINSAVHNSPYPHFPEYSKSKLYDDFGEGRMAVKKDENNNYYLKLFDVWDIGDNGKNLRTYIENSLLEEGIHGPFVLRENIPITISKGKSDGIYLDMLTGGRWQDYLNNNNGTKYKSEGRALLKEYTE